MLKKVLLVAAAFAFVISAGVTAPGTADAMTCDEAAKMKYPDGIVDRIKYKRECKKAWKDANGKGILNKIKG